MGRICLGLKSVLVKAVLFYALASPIITISNVDVPIRVRRRIGGDIYYFTSSNNSFTICHDDNITFLVSERRCVKNQELFDGNYYID